MKYDLVHRSSLIVHRSSKAVRRPRPGQRHADSVRGVPRLELATQLLQPSLLVAIDQHVDLREGAAALLARLGDGIAGELVEHGALDLADYRLLRFLRGSLLFLFELLAEEEGLAGRGAVHLAVQVAQRLHAAHERIAPLLRIELDPQRPLLFA